MTRSVGDKVLVKAHRRIAVIERFLSDIEGGVVLDRFVAGFRYWNVADLRALTGEKEGQDG